MVTEESIEKSVDVAAARDFISRSIKDISPEALDWLFTHGQVVEQSGVDVLLHIEDIDKVGNPLILHISHTGNVDVMFKDEHERTCSYGAHKFDIARAITAEPERGWIKDNGIAFIDLDTVLIISERATFEVNEDTITSEAVHIQILRAKK